eukprot:344589-Prorocentrum_minimum.AAC.2
MGHLVPLGERQARCTSVRRGSGGGPEGVRKGSGGGLEGFPEAFLAPPRRQSPPPRKRGSPPAVPPAQRGSSPPSPPPPLASPAPPGRGGPEGVKRRSGGGPEGVCIPRLATDTTTDPPSQYAFVTNTLPHKRLL